MLQSRRCGCGMREGSLLQQEKHCTTQSSKRTLMPQPPYPLHPSVVDKLAPQYVSFYNQWLINVQPVHLQPLSASRNSTLVIPGSTQNLPVRTIRDYFITRVESEGPSVRVRCFTPEGEPPSGGDGWPIMVYFHGGGWVLGDIDTENTVCTNMCARARCVVITTDYRLAPENPYPAALHDCWEALLWTVNQGAQLLNLDTSKIAIGGASAGGNLAAAITQKALRARQPLGRNPVHDITFILQLLVVPVTDNTATIDNNSTYKTYEHTAALPAVKMMWYRNHYLPDRSTWSQTDASPLLLSAEEFAKLPPAIILVGEVDVLKHDGEEYARKLRKAGVRVRVEVMPGMPHPFIAMDAVLDEGKRGITILCESLISAFA